MPKLPSNSRYTQAPNSDLFGDLSYTKNVDLDEEGYLRLSSRAVSLFSQKSVSNLRLPVAFGRGRLFAGSVDFAIVQAGQKGYWLTLLDSSISLNVDVGTNAPTLTTDSHGRWFNNLWHVTDDTELYSKASLDDAATYTARSASLTSGKVHCLEIFRNRNTICVGNGNTVKQFDTSYAGSTTLTIPPDFEVVSLAYSNYQMGVLANPSDSAVEQNQEAYFFPWSGAASSADAGIGIGSDMGIGQVAYKGSWLVLTRAGQLRFFTGGGWDDKYGALPLYYRKLLWGTAGVRTHLGDVMTVEGDVIYFNFNALLNAYGNNLEQVDKTMPAGILCFDPKVGFYHRYAPSISPASLITVTSGNINTTTNVFTTSSTIPSTGNPIKYISDKTSQIGGLQVPTVYYAIRLNSTTFKLALSKEDADNGVAIDVTSTGAANNYFLGLEVYDFGQSIATTSGAIALMGKDSPLYDHLIFGAELNDFSSTEDYNHINVTIEGFENRGHFITSKIPSSQIEDILQKVYSSYRPLAVNDKLIVKYKGKSILGLPVTTPQARAATRNQCSWTSSTVFTTTADLSDAKVAYDAGDDLECEIIAGAGAGVLVQISSITENAGTYTVTVAEAVPGAASGNYCDVSIDNWQVIGEVNYQHPKNWKKFTHVKTVSSNWFKLKCELRGVGTTIEESKLVTKTHQNIE